MTADTSTPSTSGATIAAGSGNARMSLSSVIRLTPAANRPASRAPARPPSGSATARRASLSPLVHRPYRVVSPGTYSANVVFLQVSVRQKNRRTCK